MSADRVPVAVVDNPGRGRYELRDGEKVIGQAQYVVVQVPEEVGGDRVIFFHTEVAEAYEGQGLAAELATFALDATVQQGRVIVPVCPYIAAFLRRHAETYAAHVAAVEPADIAAVRDAPRD
jgi:predicted GNAT family acetyltransferase